MIQQDQLNISEELELEFPNVDDAGVEIEAEDSEPVIDPFDPTMI